MASQEPLRSDNVGTNLTWVLDRSASQVFVNAFKQARPWQLQDFNPDANEWSDSQQLPVLDRYGWPLILQEGSALKTSLFTGLDGNYRSGLYQFSYEGQARFEWSGDAKLVRSEQGHMWVDVKPSDIGIDLRILEISEEAPPKNFQLIHESDGGKEQLFRDDFLQGLKLFNSIRFMDWQRTNHSPLSSWSNRTPEQSYTQTLTTGVAIELQLALTNQLGIAPWFVVPHAADDQFVRNFANLIKTQYLGSKPIYLEYSNEVWNTQFKQYDYVCEKGIQLKLATKPPEACERYYVQRALEIFEIFQEVFGPDIHLIKVLSGKFVSVDRTERILSWKDAYKHIDALAIAPYFGGGSHLERMQSDGFTLETVFELLEESLEKNAKLITSQKRIADKYNVPLIAYEAGQHLVASRKTSDELPLVDLYASANRDHRMYAIYQAYLHRWNQIVGNQIMLYSYQEKFGRYGSWGLVEWENQFCVSAKYRAVLDFMLQDTEHTCLSLNR